MIPVDICRRKFDNNIKWTRDHVIKKIEPQHREDFSAPALCFRLVNKKLHYIKMQHTGIRRPDSQKSCIIHEGVSKLNSK